MFIINISLNGILTAITDDSMEYRHLKTPIIEISNNESYQLLLLVKDYKVNNNSNNT